MLFGIRGHSKETAFSSAKCCGTLPVRERWDLGEAWCLQAWRQLKFTKVLKEDERVKKVKIHMTCNCFIFFFKGEIARAVRSKGFP